LPGSFAVLDFRRHYRNRQPVGMGMNTPRRLLMLLGLGALMLLLVWRGQQWSRPGRSAWSTTGIGRSTVQARLGGSHVAGNPDDLGGEPGAATDRSALFPGVNREYLDTVQDDTVFRAAESNAWFHLLDLLSKTEESALASASVGHVDYLQLDEQPESYRGRLVTLEGVVRAAKQVAAPENEYDIKQYYQLWLQPDRGDENLIVVYALELPQGFPLGEKLDQPGGVTGFFFKRWAYTSRGGIATAPLVLAKTIAWEPTPVAGTTAPVDEQVFLAVAVALLLALVVVGWLFVRSRRPRHSAYVGAATITIPEPGEEPVEPRDPSSTH
jgi:hypothetical protein